MQRQLPELWVRCVHYGPILIDEALVFQALHLRRVNPWLVRVLVEIIFQCFLEALVESFGHGICELFRSHLDVLNQIIDGIFISGHLLVQLGNWLIEWVDHRRIAYVEKVKQRWELEVSGEVIAQSCLLLLLRLRNTCRDHNLALHPCRFLQSDYFDISK